MHHTDLQDCSSYRRSSFGYLKEVANNGAIAKAVRSGSCTKADFFSSRKNSGHYDRLHETPSSLDFSQNAKEEDNHSCSFCDKNDIYKIGAEKELCSDKDFSNDVESKILSSERNLKRPTNDFETLIHLLKGNVGTGILALPSAFMKSGLYMGLATTLFIGIICVHCMHLILHSSRDLCKRMGASSLNYERTVEMAFALGPKRFRSWNRVVHYTVMTFLICTQMGFCCVYYVFISQNVYQVVECISGGSGISPFYYMLLIFTPILLICYIPNLKHLAPLSMVANFAQWTALVITLYYLVKDLPKGASQVPAFNGLSNMPLFFGTALFAFEGIGLVLPLENNMKTPDHFPGWTGVLNTGMVVVICLYSCVGFFGYMKFGDAVLGSITLNLPGDEVLAQSVKVLMSISIFLSFPLQLYVVLQITLPTIKGYFASKRTRIAVEYGYRTGLVIVTFLLASVVPNIALFTNLVGAVCSSMIALVFPPICDTLTNWPNNGKYKWKLWKNVLISLFGFFGFLTGTYGCILEMAAYFSAGGTHELETSCS